MYYVVSIEDSPGGKRLSVYRCRIVKCTAEGIILDGSNIEGLLPYESIIAIRPVESVSFSIHGFAVDSDGVVV